MAAEVDVLSFKNLFVEKHTTGIQTEADTFHVGILLFPNSSINENVNVPSDLIVRGGLYLNSLECQNSKLLGATTVLSMECEDLSVKQANLNGNLNITNDLTIIKDLDILSVSSLSEVDCVDLKSNFKTNDADLTVNGDTYVVKLETSGNAVLNSTTCKSLSSTNGNFNNFRIEVLNSKDTTYVDGRVVQSSNVVNELSRTTFNSLNITSATLNADTCDLQTCTAGIFNSNSVNAASISASGLSSFNSNLNVYTLTPSTLIGNLVTSNIQCPTVTTKNITVGNVQTKVGVLNQLNDAIITQNGISKFENQLLPTNFQKLDITGNIYLQAVNGIFFPDGTFQNTAFTSASPASFNPLSKFQQKENSSTSSEISIYYPLQLLKGKMYEISFQINFSTENGGFATPIDTSLVIEDYNNVEIIRQIIRTDTNYTSAVFTKLYYAATVDSKIKSIFDHYTSAGVATILAQYAQTFLKVKEVLFNETTQ